MKEKLKKVFTNKDFWTALIGCLGLLLSIALSYFTGFKDGILLDNTIRTELIEKAVDDAKNNKIDIEKKESIDYSQLEFIAIPSNTTDTTTYFFDLTYFANSIAYEYDSIIDLYTFYNSNGGSTINLFSSVSQSFRGGTNTASYNLRVTLSSVNYTLSILCNYSYYDGGALTGSEIFKYTYNSTTGAKTFLFKNNNIILFNSFNSNLPSLQLFDYGVGCFEIGKIPSSGATAEELEQAYQSGINVGYQSGVIEGINEYKSSQEYKDELQVEYDKGKEDGYDIGYQARQDSVEDTEQKVNTIWTILEKAITSVLNVLSFEILPGMPLYICIGVPILLAVLLWFIKMGQS